MVKRRVWLYGTPPARSEVLSAGPAGAGAHASARRDLDSDGATRFKGRIHVLRPEVLVTRHEEGRPCGVVGGPTGWVSSRSGERGQDHHDGIFNNLPFLHSGAPREREGRCHSVRHREARACLDSAFNVRVRRRRRRHDGFVMRSARL